MKYIKKYENNLYQDKIETILNYYPNDPDFRHLPKIFNVSDIIVGNVHIRKDAEGSYLRQLQAMNKSFGKILEEWGNSSGYRVMFFNDIPYDNDIPFPQLNENPRIKLLSGRDLRLPSKKEMKDFINNLKENLLTPKQFEEWLEEMSEHIIKLYTNKYNL